MNHTQGSRPSSGVRVERTHETELMYAFVSMSALFVLAKLTREQIRPAQPKYLVCSTARMLRSASEALQYGWTIMLHYLEQQRSHSKANREQEQGSRSLVLSSGRKLLKLMTLIWASRVTRNLHMFSPNPVGSHIYSFAVAACGCPGQQVP